VLSGPCGAGKTTVLSIAEKLAAEFNLAVFLKRAVRPVRAGAVRGSVDSILSSREEFDVLRRDSRFWTYDIVDDKAGLNIDELRECCKRHSNVFCTLIKGAFIRRVQRELRGVRVIPVYVYADRATRHDRITTDLRSIEEADHRRSHEPAMLAEYEHDPTLFRHVLLNIFGPTVLEQHVRDLMELHDPSRNTIAEQPERARLASA
jgi:guanylate kinase